jgi:hypothetical protein
MHVGFGVLTAVVVNAAILWYSACKTYVNLRFRGTYHLHLQGRNLKTVVICSFKTSLHIRTTRRYITSWQQLPYMLLCSVSQQPLCCTLNCDIDTQFMFIHESLCMFDLQEL